MRLLLASLIPLLVSAADAPVDLLRTWQGIPGIERTPKGRLFVCWYSGGNKEPAPENTVYLAYSGDQGKTFTRPVPIAGPLAGARAFDPTLWRDPRGRLWYIFNRGNRDRAEHGVYARICQRPDAAVPVWGPEFRIGYDEAALSFRMNKVTVLKTGEWIMPVTHAAEPVRDWFAGPRQRQGVGISTDRGKTWKLHGSLEAPHWALENMVVQLRDGRLWMLIRTGAGVLWESHSSDRGRTWTPARAGTIASPGSRFFIRRMASGNLLLVNHYKFKGRSHLTAQLSTDDGKTWNDGLLLDERTGVSYPDAVEGPGGLIRVIYDRDRQGAGEILLATFRERDVAAGKDVSGEVRLKQAVDRLEKPIVNAAGRKLLLPGWDPKAAADKVMAGLVRITAPQVKGAHDAEFAVVNDRAWIVSMNNDVQPGETPEWPYIYDALTVVDLTTLTVEKTIPFARGGETYGDVTLPEGACFVPRILRKDARTLRCFFASEAPKQRQSQTWYRDFDMQTMAFEPGIHRAKIKTAAGVFDMQPQPFYEDAVAQGFTRTPTQHGLYMIDSFKQFDGKTHLVLNNFAAGQNALGVLLPDFATFEVLGHFNRSGSAKLTEAAVNRMPDGSWIAICRQDGGKGNYMFSTSRDGRTWSDSEYRAMVPNGGSSKPLLERFYGVYYLGWQESTRINKVGRSVFNVDVSADGVNWERKYRFESEKSFQYASFHEYRGTIYLTATQGDSSGSRKERIMFGRLE
jgi:hypothetical protein